jgi:hypothetical protein
VNLSEIRAAVNAYVHRQDPQTTNNETTAIAFAQAEISRNFFPREAYEIATLPVVDGVADLPADFGAADAVVTAAGDLGFKNPREFAQLLAAGTTQSFYTLTGSELRVDPALTSVILNYYARPATLSNDSDTSWLSVSYPDLLTWMAIAEQQRFVQDWDQAGVSEGHAYAVADRATAASKRIEAAGGRLMMRSN